MRMLFIAGGSAATVFALAPVATAARNAGHEVFMAATGDMAPVIAGMGLPAVRASSQPLSRFIYADRDGRPATLPSEPAEQVAYTGTFHARMAAAWLPVLGNLVQDWRPDVVVGGTFSYAAPLLAARFSVPWVRHTWDAIDSWAADSGAERELAAELAELGLAGLPPADLLLEVCPPSLRPPTSLPARQTVPLRWVPANGQRAVEPWMYRRGGRPRICLTAGSRVARREQRDGKRDYRQVSLDFLHALARPLAALDAELLIAVPDDAAPELRAALGDDARIGWMPLDIVARHCDLILHNGGGVTSMTALSAGLPQIAIPQGAILVPAASRTAAFGASVMLLPGDDTPERAAAACQAVLDTPRYTERAVAIAEEIASLPAPAEALTAVADLAPKARA
jgi:UDP:flavonoid glycosyltransferase YjiC (YdhE family)